jgi:site-specific recombinase XerD
MTDPTTEQMTGGFDELVRQYCAELEQLNYGRATISVYRRSITRLRELMVEHDVVLDALTPDIAAELLLCGDWHGDRRQYAIFSARRFVGYLVTQGVVKPPMPTARELTRAALRRDYEDYLRHQRGLSERTIGHCWRFADRFLSFRFGDAEVDLGAIAPGDIAAFLQRLTARRVPFRDKTPPTHLRNFFRYLFKSGLTRSNLALCILSVAQRYDARLPRHLSPEQVEAVLTAVQADRRFGQRNYAMIILLARLGLRASEVIAIRLDDINWRAGELVVRGKGQNHDRVPIPPDVGEALANYIRQDRVSTSRALFVTARAPHGPFKDGQVLNTILRQAFARAGIALPCRYVGSHVLRHSLATNLIRQGASLPEVSDMLRHRSRASTLIYVKLDIEGLRSIAQPWPVAGGAQ